MRRDRGVCRFHRRLLVHHSWPELNYTTAKGVLILFPSKPAIAPTTDPQRLVE